MQLPDLVERTTGDFDEKRTTSVVFLDVVKAFDTVWNDCLFYKLTILNVPSYQLPCLIQSDRAFGDGRLRRPSSRTRHFVSAWVA